MKTIKSYLIVVCLVSSIAQVSAQSVSCNGLNPWYSTQPYAAGSVIYFNNVQYTANSYNEGEQPDQNNGTTSSGKPWTITGQCTQPVSPKQVNCTGYPAYSASAVYGNNGPNGANAYAIYNNNLYQAQWYVQGSAPDLNNQNAWLLQGQCVAGGLVVTGTLNQFTSFAENPSASQSFQVNGTNLTGSITVTAPANFELALTPLASTSTGWSNSVTVSETGGTASATVYVIYNAALAGSQSGTITIASTGLASQSIAVSGVASPIWDLGSNQQDITFGANGNIGIGTTQPSQRLTLANGNLLISSIGSGIIFPDGSVLNSATSLNQSTASGWAQTFSSKDSISFITQLQPVNIQSALKLGTGSLYLLGAGAINIQNGGATYFNYNNNTSQIYTTGEPLLIQNPRYSGNVGIGQFPSFFVQSVTSKLTINGIGQFVGQFTPTSADPAGLTMGNNIFGSATGNLSGYVNKNIPGYSWIQTTNQPLVLNPISNSNNYVAIGFDPSVYNIKLSGYRLAVNGWVMCTQLQVQNVSNWPDFVFEEGYQLTPLNKVEENLKKEKHLPGMPTTSEVQENGVNVGEMNAKLLQKVEELYLYVISQGKELEAVKKQNAELKARLDAATISK
jgi:hypothetical protein